MLRHRRLEILIAAADEICPKLRPLQHQTAPRFRTCDLDRLVDQGLVGDDATRLEPAARGDYQLRTAIVDARRKFAGGKPAENDGVNRTDAGAGEHGKDRLRHHRHIKDDTITFADAALDQRCCDGHHFPKHLIIGKMALLAVHCAVEDDCSLAAAAGGHMPVQAIVAGIGFRAGEPAAIHALIGRENPLRRLEPVDVIGRFAPEGFGITFPGRIGLMIAVLHLLLPRTCKPRYQSRRH